MHGSYRVQGRTLDRTVCHRPTSRRETCPQATLGPAHGRVAAFGLGDSHRVTDLGTHLTVRAGHGDISVPISPTHGHAKTIQLTKQRGSRLAIVVAGAHRDHREPSVRRGQERMVRISAAVMRDLEYVGRDISPDREQLLLRVNLGIAGQEDPNSLTLSPHHQ